ncbi:SMC-Scp complex subunit ScpB [Candidatus Woesearchaeota archaeon CG10_big_fil_rev_8_21_14_0_10_32_9]|nr:MAG: SMC-Scp complex subunit ScpB [Candidatus Woesearchaeota archaeon CG10_big_fil_rev_8_21_14_0_10_32_9]
MKDWEKIEAVLFASGKYLSEDQIAELIGVQKKDLKHALTELEKHYSTIETSLKVFKEGDAWKLNVKEEFTGIIKNLVSEAEMPKPVMETLAIVAYKNPILQSEVIDTRGSGAYDHISILEDKGFITREKQGRTFKLKVTDKFYEYFDVDGVSKLTELFKCAKKPEAFGTLEVYSEQDVETEKTEFSDKILERMKKLDSKPEEEKEKNNFLNDMDSKINSAKSRIDIAERDINEHKHVESSEQEESVEKILEKVNQEIDELSNEDSEPSDEPEEDSSDKS